MKGKINNGQSSAIEQDKKDGKQWLSTTHLLLCPFLSYASAPYLFWTVARNQTWTKLNGGNWLWADSVWEHSPSSSPAGDPVESRALPGQRKGHMKVGLRRASLPAFSVYISLRNTLTGMLGCFHMESLQCNSLIFAWMIKWCFYFFSFLSLKYTLTYALGLLYSLFFFSVGLCFSCF